MDIDILTKYMTGEMSEKDKNIFMEQIKLNKDVEMELNQYQELLETIDQSRYFDNNYINKAFDKVSRKIENRQRKRQLALYYKAIAAVIILVTIFSAVFYFYKPITYISKQSIVFVDLPDESAVMLNKNSEIKYYPNLLGRRKTKLTGEAFFDVKRNEKKPFVIDAGNTKVEVLGTSFYVSSYNPKVTTSVTVTSGRVMVRGKLSELGERDIILQKGESGTIDYIKKSLKKKEVVDQNEFVWNTGRLVYRAEDLEMVLNDLSKFYDLNIKIQSIDISNLKFTGTFQDTPVKAILSTIAQTFGIKVHYSPNDNEVLFY